MSVTVRKALREDVPQVHSLIVELAEYEKAKDLVITTPEDLARHGFSESLFECFVAEIDGAVVGFALFYTSYSTWRGPCLYLEDLCVTEECRQKGVGMKLFQAVVDEAKSRGYKRMDWQVLDWNEPAIKFYEKIGAELDGKWINGRLYFD